MAFSNFYIKMSCASARIVNNNVVISNTTAL
ncbi:MAG: hypothetical protein JWO94_3602 [Verrucomicrobiaceae bacterium]|nr:hypothetical protein [Verrucomicrobiaceae bacterium]